MTTVGIIIEHYENNYTSFDTHLQISRIRKKPKEPRNLFLHRRIKRPIIYQKLRINYCNKRYENNGVNYFWIVKKAFKV